MARATRAGCATASIRRRSRRSRRAEVPVGRLEEALLALRRTEVVDGAVPVSDGGGGNRFELHAAYRVGDLHGFLFRGVAEDDPPIVQVHSDKLRTGPPPVYRTV